MRRPVCRDRDSADVHLDSENVSRLHAAVVHHSNGKVYLIDLQSVCLLPPAAFVLAHTVCFFDHCLLC